MATPCSMLRFARALSSVRGSSAGLGRHLSPPPPAKWFRPRVGLGRRRYGPASHRRDAF
jgi:hypothetical protein